MNRIKCITGQYACNFCNQNNSFCERINICSVKKFECPHFNIIFIKLVDGNNFKLKLTFVCQRCYKVQIIDFNIGKTSPQNQLITDQTYTHACCSKSVEVLAFLSEEFLGQNEERQNSNVIIIDNNFNNNSNNNNFSNNFQNLNNLTHNNSINNPITTINIKEIDESIKNELDNFNSLNIIEFNKKDRIVTFLDEQNNQSYKIYTMKSIRVKNLLDDLCAQYPELNYNNRKLTFNNLDVILNSNINTFIKDNNSTIIIRKAQ